MMMMMIIIIIIIIIIISTLLSFLLLHSSWVVLFCDCCATFQKGRSICGPRPQGVNGGYLKGSINTSFQ